MAGVPVAFFDSWGELGVSSLAWRPSASMVLYVTTGDQESLNGAVTVCSEER
jgi:hypothetical protein